jgi:hypothetical protein
MIGIAFHGHQLAIDGISYQATTDATERANGSSFIGSFSFGGVNESRPALTRKNYFSQAQSAKAASQTLKKSSAGNTHVVNLSEGITSLGSNKLKNFGFFWALTSFSF